MRIPCESKSKYEAVERPWRLGSKFVYLIDGKNIAEGCPVTASGVWENNRDYDPSKVTDGKTDTFWLLPDKAKDGWIQIKLPQ